MGKRAVEIVDLDVKKLLDILNAALSEEWLAYYQYWIGARVMHGPMRMGIESEFQKHAKEELHHAEMVADRIIELGGTPVLSPNDWMKLASCKYDAPIDQYIEAILDQNLMAERCAIQRYQNLANMTMGKDHATYNMAVEILKDELDHENDIEAFLQDIHGIKEAIKRG